MWDSYVREKSRKKKPHIHHLFVFGVGIVLYLFITLFYIFFLHNFCFSSYEFEINIKPFLFQLAKKTTRKTDGKSAPTYDDDYETGGGSTVYKRNSLFFSRKNSCI